MAVVGLASRGGSVEPAIGWCAHDVAVPDSALTWKFSLEQSEHRTYMGARERGLQLKVGRVYVVVCFIVTSGV